MSLRDALKAQAEIWHGYTSDNPDVAAGFELAAGKLKELLAAHPVEADCGALDRSGRRCVFAPGHHEGDAWTSHGARSGWTWNDQPAERNTTHPVGRRSVPGIHHAEDCPMRVGLVTTGCFCGREGEREPANN